MNASAMRQSHQAKRPTHFPTHFPSSNFRHLLTLFSKSFASFLHSTCSLLVSLKHFLSFRWSLPPTLRSTPKECDLRVHTYRTRDCKWQTRRSPALVTFSTEFASAPGIASCDDKARLESLDLMLSPSQFIRHYWGNTKEKMRKGRRANGRTGQWADGPTGPKNMINIKHIWIHINNNELFFKKKT